MAKRRYITLWKCGDCGRKGQIKHDDDPKYKMLIFSHVQPDHMDKSGICSNRQQSVGIFKFDTETFERIEDG